MKKRRTYLQKEKKELLKESEQENLELDENEEENNEVEENDNLDNEEEDIPDIIDDEEEDIPDIIDDEEDIPDIIDDEEEDIPDIIGDEEEETLGDGQKDFSQEEEEEPLPTREDSDSSDEEVRNPVGDIPMWWYDDFDHIGYDLEGNKIIKSEKRMKTQSSLERLLAMSDDPNFKRTLYDEVNDREFVLNDDDIHLIKNIQKGKFPPGFNPYEEFPVSEYKDSIHPLSNAPAPKSRFIPSKWEAKKVNYLIKALNRGWIKVNQKEEEEEKYKKRYHYDIWDEERTEKEKEELELLGKLKKPIDYLPPPKASLPGHHESYNPPEEYLPSESQIRSFKKRPDGLKPFIAKKYDNLRSVPLYEDFIPELYSRCLELYLCPRTKPKKPKITSKDLLPELPKPSELKPFPSKLSITYKGHKGRIRSISIHPNGQWIASASDDKTVRIWEVQTGICFKTFPIYQIPIQVHWNPNPDMNIISVVTENTILFYAVNVGTSEQYQSSKQLLLSNISTHENNEAESGSKGTVNPANWELVNQPFYEKFDISLRPLIKVVQEKTLTSLNWHPKGTYFATVTVDQGSTAVSIHHLGNKKSQFPLKKNKGVVTVVSFHPTKPQFFVATQTHIKIYNLMKRTMFKKLITGSKHISSISPHPAGDNVIMGGYDKKVSWFDLDLSTKPYKTLRYHTQAVRKVEFHRKYPLFASCSDDCSIRVFHCMVFDDLSKNPLIVPVKIFKNIHQSVKGLGILDCVFHPEQPWLFSCGADKDIHLYT